MILYLHSVDCKRLWLAKVKCGAPFQPQWRTNQILCESKKYNIRTGLINGIDTLKSLVFQSLRAIYETDSMPYRLTNIV